MRRIILFVVLASLATIGSFSSASDNERVRTSYDQESQRQKLQELRQKLQQMQRDLDQQQGKLPRLVVPPPGQRDLPDGLRHQPRSIPPRGAAWPYRSERRQVQYPVGPGKDRRHRFGQLGESDPLLGQLGK